MGSALFASNISTIHLVGLAASGYNEGLVWGNFEWMAVFTLVLLVVVFAPFYYRNQVVTLPEFFDRRYSGGSRTMLAVMAVAGALFIHSGVSLYAGAALFRNSFGIDVMTSIMAISVVVAIYTVLGGLRAVVLTETVQTAILIAGAVIVTVFAILTLPENNIHNLAEFRQAVKPEQLHMLQTDSDVGLNWYAVFLGYPVLGIWYWCTDQTIVQRVLAARTERDAQLVALFAGSLKILPVFVLVLPGVIGYVLFQDLIGADANQTLPVLINELIPTGLKGLIAAAILAALISTIATALNSCGTLVAVDIAQRIKPGLSDASQVRVGRISAVAVMLLAMLWSTQGGRYSIIFEAINAIAAHLAPPITNVFLFGVFSRRGTQQASLVTLSFGLQLGAVMFLFDLPVIGAEKIVTDGWGIPFLMQTWWSFCLCSVLYWIVSLATPPPDPAHVDGLTWDHPLAVFRHSRTVGFTDPGRLALLLLGTLAVMYVVFR